jgi:hypothetical protein
MDDLKILRDAWGQAAPPSAAAHTAARGALLEQIAAGAQAPAREFGGVPREDMPTPGRAGRRHRMRPGRFHLAGGVAVAAAAAAVAAVIAGVSPAGGPHPSEAKPGATPTARSFLLATAVKAAQAPATAGTYWYTRERDVEPTIPYTKTRKLFVPGITYAATEESWMGAVGGRTIVDEDLSFGFASAKVKSQWQAMGRPRLATAAGTSTRPSTENYGTAFFWGYGKSRLTMAGIRALPTTAAGLDRALRKMWNGEPDKAAAVGRPDPSYGEFLIQWAATLLSGPATPGTRAAMYQLLARQPGVTIITPVTDPLGRTGVAIADGGDDYLVVDPQTAQILAYTPGPVAAGGTVAMTAGTRVLQAMGWTSQLGRRPLS